MELNADELVIFDKAVEKLTLAHVNVDLIPANGTNPVWADVKQLIRMSTNEVLVLRKFASGISIISMIIHS